MSTAAQRAIKGCANTADLHGLAHQLLAQLTAEYATPLTDNRARALLRASAVFDEANYAAFGRLVEKEENLRVVLFDLIEQSGLNPSGGRASRETIPWLALLVATFAHKSGYPIEQLDPATPPALHTPAGMLLQQAGAFMRQELQRSATDRVRLAKKLAFDGAMAPRLDELAGGQTIAPVPPYFRSPVPVRYPEYTPPIQVDSAETAPNPLPIPPEPAPAPPPPPPPALQRGAPITITTEDVEAARPRQTPERVARQVRVGQPKRIPAPNPSGNTGGSFLDGLRGLFKSETFKTTKLRVIVQEYPDGPGLYGLQVRVTCKGIKSFVAGTTDKDGRFLCELPVRLTSGLTYDVDITWPRDMGGETERKSMTLNADRTEFTLPFYRRVVK